MAGNVVKGDANQFAKEPNSTCCATPGHDQLASIGATNSGCTRG